MAVCVNPLWHHIAFRSKDHATYTSLNISRELEDNMQGEAVSLILNI